MKVEGRRRDQAEDEKVSRKRTLDRKFLWGMSVKTEEWENAFSK